MATNISADRRPKRQAARNVVYTQERALKVNPALYVGYVEDLETPEMIMKKFEVLEQFEAQKQKSTNERKENERDRDDTAEEEFSSKKKKKVEEEDDEKALTEEELREIFRRTSAFTAASTLRPPPLMMEAEYDSDGELIADEGWDVAADDEEIGASYYFLEGDSDQDDGGWGERRSRRRSKKVRREPRERTKKPKSDSPPLERSMAGVNRDRSNLLLRVRRRKATDPNAISFARVPNDPVPSSWAKKILQYIPPKCTHAHSTWNFEDVLMQKPVDFSDVPPPVSEKLVAVSLDTLAKTLLDAGQNNEGFNGVVLNPPWKEPRPGAPVLDCGITPEDLLKLPLGDKTFLPSGFVFIWVPKHWLLRTLQALEQMDLHYVENAVVVNERVGDGPPVSQPCSYFSQQKETLLVCRRGQKHAASGRITWAPVELRHQRISDVHMACYRPSLYRKDIPAKAVNYVYKMVETMLPLARFNSDRPTTKAHLCEVWADNSSRSGWIFVQVTH